MKPTKSFLSVFILLLISQLCFSQFKNTLKYTPETPPVKASLNDILWIQGHWRGEAFGGLTEEIWAPPLGNSMMFSFKLVNDNVVSFYEVGFIKQIGETLILKLKHFDGSLKGWEKKDETIDFKLVSVEPGKIYFDQLTFEKISKNEINVYVVISHDDGSHEEVKFNYKRYQ
ncbi:DUF6265 family protein [Abyssalbus ytuae]|uniref:DUF6265 family protein n=1 Tax=Abyssalbus ytuae TaxID=2926907 RepID=A0A9E7D1X0_9FLAO|nr:DUF6265 family protein [Abyssalbus ytuae]UOB16089.1 DUF6265 family protein [Abyssalbus ytuae]